MAGESQAVPRSQPDPSVMTTEQLDRAIEGLRKELMAELGIRDQRLEGIDTATDVLNETVTRTPTDIQKEIGHLKELMNNQFTSIERQFSNIESQSKAQLTDSRVAVDKALSAARELVQLQTQTFSEAINRSEAAYTRSNEALGKLIQNNKDAGDEKLNDIKDRLTKIEAIKQGATEQRIEGRQSNAALYGALAFVGTVLGLLIVIVNLITSGSPN